LFVTLVIVRNRDVSWRQLHFYLVKIAWARRRAHRPVLLNILNDVDLLRIRLVVLFSEVFQNLRLDNVIGTLLVVVLE
jgi:hypothetical protein